MKLINQNAILLNEENPLKLIELAGRVSHKSEDKITNYSYKKFLINMLTIGHTATLEFGDVYLRMEDNSELMLSHKDDYFDLLLADFTYCPYCKSIEHKGNKYVYTNLRFILDSFPSIFEDIINDTLPLGVETFEPKNNDPYKRYCFNIICNRGVSHELVRHRISSFLQESTRYCNYSKDKFSSELNIINPFNKFIETNNFNKFIYDYALRGIENIYNGLTSDNNSSLKAQEARGILPNDLKTEMYMTSYLKDWIGHNRESFVLHIFDEEVTCNTIKGFDTLRNDKSAHPQAVEIATIIKSEFGNVLDAKDWSTIKETYYE